MELKRLYDKNKMENEKRKKVGNEDGEKVKDLK